MGYVFLRRDAGLHAYIRTQLEHTQTSLECARTPAQMQTSLCRHTHLLGLLDERQGPIRGYGSEKGFDIPLSQAMRALLIVTRCLVKDHNYGGVEKEATSSPRHRVRLSICTSLHAAPMLESVSTARRMALTWRAFACAGQ